MRIQFSTANQIYFGEGILTELIPTMAVMGNRFLVVAGKQGARVEPVINLLKDKGADTYLLLVEGEPDVRLVSRGVALAQSCRAEVILAIGGGSVMDAAKAISGLSANPGEVTDYLEVVGAGKALTRPGPAVIAVPTTAGTGAEVTRNAVISVPEEHIKVSIRSPHIMPRLAVVDPEMTYSMPPQVTACTGMDALAQLIEPYLSIRANPFTDLFCLDGMKRVSRSLLAAYRDGRDKIVRREMSYASLLGGLALANAGLGAVHGFAGVIGGLYQASHGAICARLLSPVIRANHAVIQKKNPDSDLQEKFSEVSSVVTGKPDATVESLVDWLEALCSDLMIPRLRDLGVREVDFEQIAGKAAASSSMKANPVQLDHEVLLQILTEAW